MSGPASLDPNGAGVPGLCLGSGRWPAQTLTGRLAQSWQRRARRLGDGRVAAAPRNDPEMPDFVAAVTERLPAARGSALVSIIILNLNGAALLDAALTSLYRVNRYPAIEIILVDHASRDHSLAVAGEWARLLPLTIVPRAENHTFAYSCNRAAALAAGEFLLLLNNDVVLTEDVVGHMVATVEHGASAVGLKLYDGSSDRRLNHIGMRFRWSDRYRVLQPYNAVPAAADRQIARSPAQFPAVTAAALLCRRGDYLAVGGLCEDYVYGCEDVDLCLKLRLRTGRPVICRNDIGAIHGEGRTRFGKTSKARRSRWYRHNIAVLERRFGYRVRREALAQLFTDDGSYWGRRPVVLAAAPASDAALRRVFDTLAAARRWTVRQSADDDGWDLDAVDLLLVADPAYRLARLRHRAPHLASAAWIVGDPAAWARYPLETHDLLLAGDAAAAAALLRERGLCAAVLDPLDPQCVPRLVAFLADNLFAGHHAAIKSTGPRQLSFAGELAGWLRRAGLRVRIDPPAYWRTREAIRDDVNILLPGARRCPPVPGKINLACGDAAAHPLIDAELPMSQPETLAAAILNAVAVLHPRQLRGAADPPLDPGDATLRSFADPQGPSSERSRRLLRARARLGGRPAMR